MLKLSVIRFIGRLPLRVRMVALALFPILLALALFVFVGLWSFLIAGVAGILMGLLAALYQKGYLRRATLGVHRIRSIDRNYRLPIDGVPDESRLSTAINRLADSIDDAVSNETARRIYHETILNEMNDGILVVSSGGVLQYSNPAAREILDFDVSYQESSQVQLASKVNIYEVNDVASISSNAMESCRRVIELYNPIRYLEVISTPLPREEFEVGRALLIVRDRTGEYRLAESMREFVANASHELRTPIAAIQACVETLKFGAIDDPDSARDFLNRIEDSSNRMAILVADLMDLAVLETGRATMHMAPVEPKELMGNVVAQFGPIADKSDIDLRIEDSDAVGFINVDREKMERVLSNLVSNALKFTSAGGNVRMYSAKSDGVVSVSVSDDGQGIGVDELPHVFDRFYKVAPSNNDHTSFGLGLAIAKNIIELHEGEIIVHSVLGEGSTFTVKLPSA